MPDSWRVGGKGIGLALVLCLTLLVPSAGRAEPAPQKQATEYTPPAWPSAPTETALLGRLALITLLAVAVAAVVIVWARRAARLPAGPSGQPPPLELVGSAALGSGSTLHLIEVGSGEYFVVGCDRTGLKAIQAVAEPFEQTLEMASGG